jgi:hypothetical protein
MEDFTVFKWFKLSDPNTVMGEDLDKIREDHLLWCTIKLANRQQGRYDRKWNEQVSNAVDRLTGTCRCGGPDGHVKHGIHCRL